MIKRVKASEIDSETMRLVRGGAGDDATSVEIESVGRVGNRNGDIESIRVETTYGGIKLYAPNEMVRVEMIEPAPTTTITIEVPAGSERVMREELSNASRKLSARAEFDAASALVPALAELRRAFGEDAPALRHPVTGLEDHRHTFKPGIGKPAYCAHWVVPNAGDGFTCRLPADHSMHTVDQAVDQAAEQAAYWAMRRDSARRDAIALMGEGETNKIERELEAARLRGLATLAQSVANNAARTVNPMRTDVERHEAHAFIGPLVSVTRTDCGTPGCPCVSGEVEV